MSQKVTGQVFKVYEKAFPPKKGKPGTTWYSIKLEGDSLYYRCKAHNPGDIAGKQVEFTADGFDDTNAEIDVSTLKVITPKAAAGGSGNSAVQSGPALSGGARDSSIQYQSSRKDAIAMVDVLLKNGAVKLPAKEASREEAVSALVDSYTELYFTDIPSLGAVARANGTTTDDEPKDVGPGDEE